MDRYQKVQKVKGDRSAISENELRVTAQGRMRNYMSYALSLLQDKGSDDIVIKATGRAISKTVMIAELLKRRVIGLHQNTTIGSVDITDTWEPLEEGLLPLETTRHVSVITISLSKKELDSSSIGYQAPIPADQVKPLADFEDEREGEVTDQQIWEAVLSCSGDKSPGPDGYSFNFIKQTWDVIGADFSRMVREFFKSGKFPAGANSSFLTIIPKRRNPTSFSDYRPISLVSSFYKVISKVMSIRLAVVMPSVISNEQHGFRKNFQTLDCVMAANEVVHYLRKSNKQGFLLKLDFEKAYDSVEWGFLDDTLRHMGFGDKWRLWIRQCIGTNRVSVLINGSPTGEFQVGRGLRQGCPLSPFLFNLIAESLHLLLVRAEDRHLIHGIGNENRNWKVSHLQFADDSLIFLPNEEADVRNSKEILRWFEALSGLRINFNKSTLIGINIEEERSAAMAAWLGCRTESLPFPYLGSFVGLTPRRIKNWDFLISKMQKKLATWKGKLLSIGGRVTLIKAALRSIPVYNMSIFRMPIGVINKCEKIMRSFLWCGEENQRGMCKVSWKDVIKSEECGGLEIGNLQHRNEAFLFRWGWLLSTGHQRIWAEIVRKEYGLFTLGDLRSASKAKVSPIWHDIMKACGRGSPMLQTWRNAVDAKLGNGTSLNYWWDCWLGPTPLADMYPELYKLCSKKHGRIADFCQQVDDDLRWRDRWRRTLQPAEEATARELQQRRDAISLSNDSDKWVWKLEGHGRFSVHSCTAAISRFKETQLQDDIWNTCWNHRVPYRISFFIWLALRLRIPSRSFLRSRQIQIDSVDCVCCPGMEETADHILIGCRFAQSIWDQLFTWLGIPVALPPTIALMWKFWEGAMNVYVAEARRWGTLLIFSTFWHLWLRRNKATFTQQFTPAAVVFQSILTVWYSWIKSHHPTLPYTFDMVTSSATWLISWARQGRDL